MNPKTCECTWNTESKTCCNVNEEMGTCSNEPFFTKRDDIIRHSPQRETAHETPRNTFAPQMSNSASRGRRGLEE